MKKTRFIKRGFTKNHKQRYQCKVCSHKFVYDSHTVTSCLKIRKEEFIEICVDTLTMAPIATTASRLGRT